MITDPIEQAFFVFVHLLYRQPFGMLNASMACLAVNIPLLRAGRPPITFAGVRGVDLLDGLRGVQASLPARLNGSNVSRMPILGRQGRLPLVA